MYKESAGFGSLQGSTHDLTYQLHSGQTYWLMWGSNLLQKEEGAFHLYIFFHLHFLCYDYVFNDKLQETEHIIINSNTNTVFWGDAIVYLFIGYTGVWHSVSILHADIINQLP